jgi:hypothetical protein
MVKKFIPLYPFLLLFFLNLFLISCVTETQGIRAHEDHKLKVNEGYLVFRVKKYDEKSLLGQYISLYNIENSDSLIIDFDQANALGLSKAQEIYTRMNQKYPVLKVVPLKAGKYQFGNLHLYTSVSGNYRTSYDTYIPTNNFIVENGKITYIGDIVIKTQQIERYISAYFKLEDNYDDVIRIFKLNYPQISQRYSFCKNIMKMRTTLINYEQIDTQEININGDYSENTAKSPIEVNLPYKLLNDDHEKMFIKLESAIVKYIQIKEGKEGENWINIRNKTELLNNSLLLIYTIEVITNNKGIDSIFKPKSIIKDYYFKLNFIK